MHMRMLTKLCTTCPQTYISHHLILGSDCLPQLVLKFELMISRPSKAAGLPGQNLLVVIFRLYILITLLLCCVFFLFSCFSTSLASSLSSPLISLCPVLLSSVLIHTELCTIAFFLWHLQSVLLGD